MPDLTFALTIGGSALPITNFSITGGAFGTVGSLMFTTTQAMLDIQKLDLFNLTSASPAFVEVILSVTAVTPAQPSPGGYSNAGSQPASTTTRLFGGEYVKTEFNLDDDTVVVHARDYAGVLVDQKRILTKIGKAVEKVLAPLAPGRVTVAGISNENQQVGNIVQSIAAEFGFNAVLNLSGSNRNPTVGTLYGSADQSFLQVPQSLWMILNSLARDTGYDVYVTPSRDLVFGEPGAGQPTLNLTWNVAPQDGQLACHTTKIEHHPRRNSTFRVLVISYDPTHAQATLGRATYVAGNFAGQHGLSPGLSSGSAAITADKNILGIQSVKGSNVGVTQIPLYSFHVDGLSADQANMKAEAVAVDIAKRELVLTTTIEGYPTILPTQKINLSGDLRTDFSSAPFYVSGYQQTFTLPGGGGGSKGGAGWVTKITALNIPTEGLAKGSEG